MPGAASIPATVANALSERAFEQQVVDLATQAGWKGHHHSDSRKQIRPGVFVGDKNATGFPDWLFCRPPEIIVCELKAEKGRLSPAQRDWLQALEMSGIEVYVWKPSSWS